MAIGENGDKHDENHNGLTCAVHFDSVMSDVNGPALNGTEGEATRHSQNSWRSCPVQWQIQLVTRRYLATSRRGSMGASAGSLLSAGSPERSSTQEPHRAPLLPSTPSTLSPLGPYPRAGDCPALFVGLFFAFTIPRFLTSHCRHMLAAHFGRESKNKTQRQVCIGNT